jgi:hypothetical protein
LYFDANSAGLIADTTVIRNDANEAGGGIYLTRADDVLIEYSTVIRNSAPRGGGLYATNSYDLTVSRCSFRYNVGPQGGFDPNDPNDPNASKVSQGGAMYYWSTDALVRDCVIAYNIASTSGGGIYMGGEPNSPRVINCLITNNLAGRDGGGVSVNWEAEPYFRNCTFATNAASGSFGQPGRSGFGGGLYCGYHSKSRVIDSIFWNNYALDGHEITVATGFEFGDPWPATLRVSYCDIKGGRHELRLEPDCTLDWGSDNMDDDPLFAIGLYGEHYLSQTDAGQSQQSPCVNAGSEPASQLGMTTLTTRTDEGHDEGAVDMGYHYPVGLWVEPCSYRDLIFDGVIDFMDLNKLLSYWLAEGCSAADDWCDGTDLTFDGLVNEDDYAYFMQCWDVRDLQSPRPDPPKWEVEPYYASAVVPYSISMTAKASYDAWGWDVEYYFDCTDDDAFDSGWQSSNTYVLPLETKSKLCFRVRVRDTNPVVPDDDPHVPDDGTGQRGIKSYWSVVSCAVPPVLPCDTTPPAPEPILISVEANSPNSIVMEARKSLDDSGVEYYFENTTISGHNSGWLTFAPGVNPTYIDVGLTQKTTYCYQVQARDKADCGQNYTNWSAGVCATTLDAGDSNKPTPNPMRWDETLDANGFDGWPREILLPPYNIWSWGATMRADPNTTDESGYWEFYFENTNYGGQLSSIHMYPETGGWISFAGPPYIYTTPGVMFSGQQPQFRVRARDMWGNETDWSEVGTAMPAGQ